MVEKNSFHEYLVIEVGFLYYINCVLLPILDTDLRNKQISCQKLTSDVSFNMHKNDLSLTFDKSFSHNCRIK